MKTVWTALAGAGFAAALAMGAPAVAQSPNPAQWTQDRQAIERVLVNYAVGLDTLNADLYASTFAEDADFGQGDKVRHGRAEIRKVITELIASREQRRTAAPGSPGAGPPPPTKMHHVVTNSSIEFVGPTEAKHFAYWMTVLGREGNKFEIAAMGEYEDVLVKRGGQWVFKSRRILR